MSAKREQPRLSKGVLDMKFMKRTKAQVEKDEDDQQGRSLYAQEITNKMRKNSSNFIIEPSFMLCQGLQEGRFSCRGMNPEIERLLEEERAIKASKIHYDQPKDVSDAEMAKFYHTQKPPAAHKTIHRKFEKRAPKRKYNDLPKTTKFLKPIDE